MRKNQLVAKIQHFYDTVISAKERSEDDAMSSSDNKVRHYKKSAADCYEHIGNVYSEIFKEFLYNSNERHND